jgi:hypothetical protein
MSISVSQSYAENEAGFEKNTVDDIKNNPIAKKILNNIEIAKKEFSDRKVKEKKTDEYKKLIMEQRKAAQTSLEEAITRMNEKYEEFTPRNAFAKYVSGINATHQGIYWDQFSYLNAKVALAKDARDVILEKGGTYTDAMKEYSKYAKMSKIEMLNVIKDLNIKHSFTDKKTQSYFDPNGKLPRFEDELSASCYGCNSKITKVMINSTKNVPITAEKIKPITQSEQIINLKDRLSALQKDFVNSKDTIKQKTIVDEMNIITKQIKEFKFSKN